MAHQCEHGGVHCAERKRVGVGEACDPRIHAPNERDSAIDFAERPQRERQIGHGGDAWVHPETIGQIIVAARLEPRERAFDTIPRVEKLPGVPVGHALDAMRHTRFGRIGAGGDIGEKVRRMRAHRRQIAARVARGP